MNGTVLLQNVLEAFQLSEQQRWELAVKSAPTPIVGKKAGQCAIVTEPPSDVPFPWVIAPLSPEPHQQGNHLAHWIPSLDPEQVTPSVPPAAPDKEASTRDLVLSAAPETGAPVVTQDVKVVQSECGKAAQVDPKAKTEQAKPEKSSKFEQTKTYER